LKLFGQRNWKAAFDQFKRAEATCPLVTDLPLHIGICLYRLHYYGDAINRLKPVVQSDMNNEVANRYLGWAYIRDKDTTGRSRADEGCALYEKLVQSHPDEQHAFLHQALGTMYLARGPGFMDKAVAQWRLAARQDPQYDKPHINIGWYYYTKKDYEAALEEFRTALRLGGKVFRTYMGAAAAHLGLGHLDSAAYLYQEALKYEPDDSEAHWLLGNVYEKLAAARPGNRRSLLNKALAEYRTVLRLDPNPVFIPRETVEQRINVCDTALHPPPEPVVPPRPNTRPRPRPNVRPQPMAPPPGANPPRPTVRPQPAAPPPGANRPQPTVRPQFMIVAPEDE